MGKVVILGGNARSGKSTLAYKLMNKGFHRISFDNINTALEEGLNISLESFSDELQFHFFEKVIDIALLEAEQENINTVIDMYDYLPKDVDKLKQKEKLEIYFLAYPNCTLEEIKHNVVFYAKPTDWIAQVNKEYLDSCVKRFFERNELLVTECKKYNFNLIDTMAGENRNKVLNELLLKIVIDSN